MSDLIREYLNELRAGLRLAPEETDVIVDEAEDHLRETAAAGLAAGMTEREAQQAAISAFGSVAAVVRAHRERHEWNVALAGNLVMAAWRLALLFLLAAGVSGVLDWIMDLSAGERFAGFAAGAPVGRLPAAECRKLLLNSPARIAVPKPGRRTKTATAPASSRQPSCWGSFWSRATCSCATFKTSAAARRWMCCPAASSRRSRCAVSASGPWALPSGPRRPRLPAADLAP